MRLRSVAAVPAQPLLLWWLLLVLMLPSLLLHSLVLFLTSSLLDAL